MPFFKRKPPSEAEQYYRQALRYRDPEKKEFNLRLAIENLQKAIIYEPSNPLFHYELGRAYAGSPLLAITRGANAGFKLSNSAILAIDRLKEALRLKPDYAQAFLVLGEAHMYLGEKEEALKAFQSVLDLSKNRMLRTFAERESLHVEEGISADPKPEQSRDYIKQAVAYRDKGKYRQAEKELVRALKLAPDWHWVYRNLCELGG